MRSRWLASLSLVAACATGSSDSKPAPGTKAESTPKAAGKSGAQATAAAPVEGQAPETVELTAADGTKVFADHYPAAEAGAPILLLFHQAGWNAGEYRPIAPKLVALGVDVLATDQRSGGARDGTRNRTVDALGDSTEYLPAYPDLEAALAWAKAKAKAEGSSKVLAWGSSYSAALVFKLAAEHGDELAAILAFSPGEYIGDEGTVAGWAKRVTLPVFVTSAPGEEVAAAKVILDATKSTDPVRFVPEHGVHGASILREDKDPQGAALAWRPVEEFLKGFAGRGPS